MLKERVRDFIEDYDLVPKGAGIVVGVSGGIDSLVLLRVLKKLRYSLVAAHVNYGLRDDADDDEAHVRALCRKWKVKFRSTKVDAKAAAKAAGTSVQDAAREARYRYFADLAASEGLAHVAVGHHRDDQAETLLLNLFRGAGVDGLSGMAPARPIAPESPIRLVRPLLDVRRADLEAFAEEDGLTWREDASNRDPKYRRNVVRSKVLPLVKKQFGEAVTDNLARTAELVRAYRQTVIQPELAARFAACAEEREDVAGGRLELKALGAQEGVWRGRLLLEAARRWLPGAPLRYEVVQELDGLLGAQPGRHVALGAGSVWRERSHLVFLPNPPEQQDEQVGALSMGQTLQLPQGRLSVELVEEPPVRLDAGPPGTVFADADRLAFPLVVRPWQAGDRFQPFGLNGSKLVSDLLTDLKVPSHWRQDVLVLLSEGEIIWVVPYRLGEAVRIRPGTDRFAKITFE